MIWTHLDEDLMRSRLTPPEGNVRLAIDTDAANEIDDQFALAWALCLPERLKLEAVTAAPFSFAHHLPELQAAEKALAVGQGVAETLVGGFQGWVQRLHRSGRRVKDLKLVGPAEGMELSHAEILRVFDKMRVPVAGRLHRGAERYLTDEVTPVASAAATALIDLAKSGGGPLHVAALGCLTNVASAILMAPEIIGNLVVVWTSAYPSHALQSNRPSLNLVQDVAAARVVLDCGVPHVYLPGYHIGAQLKISQPEMEIFVKGCGVIGDYLWRLYTQNPLHEMFAIEDAGRRTWVIWDLINIAWLIDPDWVPSFLTRSPVLDADLRWTHPLGRHAMREAHDVQRDEIFLHFYDTLSRHVGLPS